MDIYALRIGTGPIKGVLSGNIHPDEHAGAYTMEGAVDWLLSDDPDAVSLRAAVTFYVYPGLNAQGRFAGTSRLDMHDMGDANRIWSSAYDGNPLSATMRGIWEADLPNAPLFGLDYHDAPLSTRGAEIWRPVGSDSAWTAEARRLYAERTGEQMGLVGSSGNPTISRYWRDRGAEWAVAYEYGLRHPDGPTEWRAWGVDTVRALTVIM